MNRVVDSSAWIEWTIDGPSAALISEEMPERTESVVPTIVQFEMFKWLTREIGERHADEFIAFTTKCVVVELHTHIALLAAELSRRHHLSAADAIIYATAINQDADLLTCDAHFQGLPNVAYIPKTVS